LKLLLDTHIWIWSELAPERISSRVQRELSSPQNQLWLSPVSVWELSLLVQKGRISLHEEFDRWLGRMLFAAPLHEAQVTHDVAIESHHIQLPHRDPADHLIVATARVMDLTLVTADDRLMRSKQWKVLPNR
jgi:PIN domain nuclease of toxin-antitoxin system